MSALDLSFVAENDDDDEDLLHVFDEVPATPSEASTQPDDLIFSDDSSDESEHSDEDEEDDSTTTTAPQPPPLTEEQLKRITIDPHANDQPSDEPDLEKEFEQWGKRKLNRVKMPAMSRQERRRRKQEAAEAKKNKPKRVARWVRVTKQLTLDTVNRHKAHLLIWMAHHRWVVQWIDHAEVQACVLSLLPTALQDALPSVRGGKKRKVFGTPEQERMKLLLTWFHQQFQVNPQSLHDPIVLAESSLLAHLSQGQLHPIEGVIVFLIACRFSFLAARYVGLVDVVGVQVPGSSNENAAEERAIDRLPQQDVESAQYISPGFTCWIEFLSGSPEQWVCVDLLSQTVNEPLLFERSRMLQLDNPCLVNSDSPDPDMSTPSPVKRSKRNPTPKKETPDTKKEEPEDDEEEEDEDKKPKTKKKKPAAPVKKASSARRKPKISDHCAHRGCLYYCFAFYGDAIFDVSHRYTSDWLHAKRNRLVDPHDIDWLEQTLETFLRSEEDQNIQRFAAIDHAQRDSIEQCIPIPATKAAFNKHPMYCLPSQIGKYQEIYPKEPAGTFRGDDVYLRSRLHTLHSAEKWLEKGRAIKEDHVESPIKQVDSIKAAGDPFGVHPQTKLYGRWQTKVFEPVGLLPDGKIPTNAYGNVYLFQAWMIPIGTVHLRLHNSIITIAKKLKMDAPPAMVGWKDVKGGFSAPDIQGVVVTPDKVPLLKEAFYEYNVTRIRKKRIKERLEVRAKWQRLATQVAKCRALKQKYLPHSA